MEKRSDLPQALFAKNRFGHFLKMVKVLLLFIEEI